jgi:hypothetical protein
VDNSDGTASFKVERKTGTTGTYAQIAMTGAGITTYGDSTVVGGTTYCYRVRASNSAGDSIYSKQSLPQLIPAGLLTTVPDPVPALTTVTARPVAGEPQASFESYSAGTVVTLTATPAKNSMFSGWSGGCTDTDPCVMTGNTPVSVTATFSKRKVDEPALRPHLRHSVPGELHERHHDHDHLQPLGWSAG